MFDDISVTKYCRGCKTHQPLYSFKRVKAPTWGRGHSCHKCRRRQAEGRDVQGFDRK